MDGEFRIEIKGYDANKIVKAFTEHYGNMLAQAYTKSIYQQTGLLGLNDFCAGFQTSDSLFLVYNREGDDLKVYVEPFNKKDINLMKELINRYFKGVIRMLDKKKIKWSKPQATINVEQCPLTGVYKTRKQVFHEILENQREKLIFTPVGTLVAIGLSRYLSIMTKDDAGKELEKLLTSFLVAGGVVIGLIIVQILLTRKKSFSFKI